MQQKSVYIADVRSVFPESYDAVYFADRVYPIEKYGAKINTLAKRLAGTFGVSQRPSVLNFDKYPEIVLKNEKDHPRSWGTTVVNELTSVIRKEEIGMFSVSYNASYHTDILPNLACQIALDAKLDHLDATEELPYYGCAAGVYSISQAVEYCKEYDRPALVFVFDQCTLKMKPLPEKDPDFSKTLVSNLLFNDGGIGLLIIPESYTPKFSNPLLKINDIKKYHIPGELIKMTNGKFMMDHRLKDVVPKLVSDRLVQPFLKEHNLSIDDIDEWAIHQGGTKVLKQFAKPDHLALSSEQLQPSLETFYKYGNTSAPSCLYVLEHFFQNHSQHHSLEGINGLMVGFGAGYYMAVMGYEWN